MNWPQSYAHEALFRAVLRMNAWRGSGLGEGICRLVRSLKFRGRKATTLTNVEQCQGLIWRFSIAEGNRSVTPSGASGFAAPERRLDFLGGGYFGSTLRAIYARTAALYRQTRQFSTEIENATDPFQGALIVTERAAEVCWQRIIF